MGAGNETGSSIRAARALNHEAVSPAPQRKPCIPYVVFVKYFDQSKEKVTDTAH